MAEYNTLPTMETLIERADTNVSDLSGRLLALDQMIAVCHTFACQQWQFVPRREAATWLCDDHLDPRVAIFTEELARLIAYTADERDAMSPEARDLYETHLTRIARRLAGLPVAGVRVPLLARKMA